MNTTATLSLELSSLQARQALLTGYLDHEGRKRKVVARERASSSRVIFELVPESAARPPRALRAWQAIRPLSLTATGTPCLAVLIQGWASGWTLDPALALTAALGAIALQIAINAYNDVEDHLKLIDFPGAPGGSGVIQKGWLTAVQMRALARGALLAGVLLGLPSLVERQGLISWISVLGGLGVLAYSGKPFGLKYRALGDFAVFALCGPGLTLGFSLAAFGRSDPATLWIGAYFGFAATGILHANNLHDIELDESRGARTLASVLGFRRAQKLVPGLYLGALASLALAAYRGDLPSWTLLAPALAGPAVFQLCRRALRASGPVSPLLSGVRFQAARAHLLLGALLCGALLLTRLYG
jgi:1,4-dihydroxy-2-naphthoate octaprenyltransferase